MKAYSEITLTDQAEEFIFTYKKEKTRLLIRKQLDVHPRFASVIIKLLGVFGFHVTKEAQLFTGCVGECPVTVGARFGDCTDFIEECKSFGDIQPNTYEVGDKPGHYVLGSVIKGK